MACPNGCALGQEGCGRQALLHVCARNHVKNYLKSLNRRRSHEVEWPEISLGDGTPLTWDCSDPSPSPEEKLLQSELNNQIQSAVEELPQPQQKLFELRFIEEQSEAKIAAATGKTVHAIECAVTRIRCRLRSILLRHGYDEQSLRELLSPPQKPALHRVEKEED